MVYLLKVTVAWTLFLILFELFYKYNRRYSANRIYLLLSIAVGLLLPLIPLPSNAPSIITATQKFYPKAISPVPNSAPILTTAIPAVVHQGVIETKGPDIGLILGLIYVIGLSILLVKYVFELGKITRLIYKNPVRIIDDNKIIVTGKIHAPYSFMGRIFITGLQEYTPQELHYIILHEAAHNNEKHWLDLLLIQQVCIVFWFHPLIWRYRHLLQLQHEYNADDMAANNDPYTYGSFLLQQTLLNGVPSIAHSFHFSPIKNRIDMLTKKHGLKSGSWKYLFLLPVLLGCTLLMAETTTKTAFITKGNTTVYKGNIFKWRETDTLLYSKRGNYLQMVHPGDKKPQVVYSMNDEPVYQNELLEKPATYPADDEMSYSQHIKLEFAILCRNTPDSLTQLDMLSVVVNKEGKVVYYNVRYSRPYIKVMQNSLYWTSSPEEETRLNDMIDKIITESQDWKPATIDGKPVNSVAGFGGC